VDRTVVVSGSCAPVTARQIAWAIEHGFAEVQLDVADLCRSRCWGSDIREVVQRILAILDTGQSVIAHTGLKDSRATAGEELGIRLGAILIEVFRATTIRRVAVVGGDTAGYVARSLGIDALEMVGPLQPGAPLCVARSRFREVDGLEVVFKGGQVGYDDFFGALLSGAPKLSTVGTIQ
jgi:uncharacterized protein YgbK (DUF1537 family)